MNQDRKEPTMAMSAIVTGVSSSGGKDKDITVEAGEGVVTVTIGREHVGLDRHTLPALTQAMQAAMMEVG